MEILVTGANRGIGAALLDGYAALGIPAMGTSRDGTVGLKLDVTDPDSISELGRHYAERRLDLLVCNAAVFLDRGRSLEELSAEDWARTMAVNVTGVAETVRVLLPALRRSSGSKIAIISSQMASQERARGGSYVYRASKAAVLNFGRNLAQDLRGEGIAVGTYHPGWVRTEMGGPDAELSGSEAAEGLINRFEALDMSLTGCFETWDGRDHPL
ncbi:MAG: SDR family NAD(P)-dependent oxidoreductase [Candidatus Thalassarchaeum sp.]|nr:SDR family NAD(P)-dependent oxidoreductase [Candidatus Thalassarchaeum sp.]